MLEKTTRINALYDFYQQLLTDKQRNYMEMYYVEDFSLGEISETSNVSRQAIYDNIRRTEHMLEEYEEKLGLYGKFLSRQALLQELLTVAKEEKSQVWQEKIEKLIEIE
ncbi:putative DNA-binding protein [Gracilibacillus sp. S3-1-1]|uniref:DNA-binding protein n=1 Tax=Gracilibacillus pellucidus TaxID=3095368 RepID=A0ACC6M252_9BACI|nr:putative DNA-binding protein [Gracilibacillus sp. S3-1-1]MDX8045026.1 putative DNA-binding protein [Gracilibacillus sp. S3-1-1]